VKSAVASSDPRDRLIHAAVALFAECGFRGATTRRIAESAGVNEVTLFRLFGSKHALLEEAVRVSQTASVAPPRSTLPDEPGDALLELEMWAREHWRSLRLRRAMIRKMMSEMEEHPEMSECLNDGWDQTRALLGRYLENLRAQGRIGREVSLAAAVAVFTGTLFADAVGRDLKRGAFPSERTAVAEYTALFLRGLGYTDARRNRRTVRA
jgi:AcrR family transcriptional regulator